MTRDLRKYLAEYEAIRNEKKRKAEFYTSDLQQIKELARECGDDSFMFYAINYSLKVGFVIGYRLGRKENQKTKAST